MVYKASQNLALGIQFLKPPSLSQYILFVIILNIFPFPQDILFFLPPGLYI